MKHACVWIMSSGTACGREVLYKMVWDGGEPDSTKVREYDPFCPLHMAKAKAQKQDIE